MKIKLAILLLFFSVNSFSQNRELHIETYENVDSPYWYNWKKEFYEKIELDLIHKTTHLWHFRFWTNKQAIEIWKNAENKIEGKITNWAEEHKEYDSKNHETSNKIIYQVIVLESKTIADIISLIKSSQIKQIPDQGFIENWRQGFDGITYTIETANTTDYYFKTYWTPTAQDSLQEAIIIQDFVEKILDTTNASSLWKEFDMKIPFECYIYGGPMIKCRYLKRKEKRRLKKDKRKIIRID